ncbi:RNA polymerase sigma factor [uncultured Ruminococcus sp.]|uniref:RNA polymerase sigma factor n=1 Tax=uncultured Ruminococcus sp. TaxID=165186 RepID=UPI0026028C4C|nr:sigma-70 family RNA polymerase sigma factor [uncultured Ruminococcus sp.]
MKDIITTIVERYYDSIYYYCVARLDDADAAKDCTQEVFCALVKKQSVLKDLEYIRPWLYRAADIAMKEYRRSEARFIAASDEVLSEESTAPEPDWTDDHIRDILTKEEYSLVWKHYMEGYTIRELAGQLRISEASAYMRMTRIRRKIADVMQAKERRELP